jgi:RNA polymerase sigma factor (sigma-70 family)
MTPFPSPELVPGVTSGTVFRQTVCPQRGWKGGPVATAPLDAPGPSDAELIDSVRGGDTSAYGSLYERHVGAAYNLARQLTRSTAEADDLVAEAFAKVLDTLRDGRGPDSAFRAYLLTALRHTAYDKTRRDRKLELAEDVTEVASPEASRCTSRRAPPTGAGPRSTGWARGRVAACRSVRRRRSRPTWTNASGAVRWPPSSPT